MEKVSPGWKKFEEKQQKVVPYNKKTDEYFSSLSPSDRKLTYEDCRKILWHILNEKTNGKLTINENDAWIYSESIKYILNDGFIGDPNKGLIFSGRYGCGKTTLMESLTILNNIVNRDRKFYYDSIHRIKNKASSKPELLDRYARDDWAFDDVAQIDEEFNHFGNRKNVFTELVLMRYQTSNKTMITTNILLTKNVNDFSEIYGELIGSRIRQMFNPAFIFETDQDYREL